MTRTNPVTVNVCPRLELEALHHQLRELPTRSFLVLKWVWTGEFGKEKKHGDAKFCDSWTLQNCFSDYLKDSLACSLGWNLGYNPRYEHTMADEDVMRYSKRNLDPMPKNVSLCAIKAACRQVIRKKMLNLLNKWETGQVSIQHLMPPDCIPKV